MQFSTQLKEIIMTKAARKAIETINEILDIEISPIEKAIQDVLDILEGEK